jgi:DegV family protein with EDD domain
MLIVTDSAADLSPQEINEWGIRVVSQYINFPDEEVAAEAIAPDDFYDRLKAMVPQVPTTSQPAVGTFMEVYQQAVKDKVPVLSIHVSSGLSGTYSTAVMAAKQTPQANVTTVDTLTLSCGERFQVLAAAHALKSGWSVEKIVPRLKAIGDATEVIYSLETLEYLARGGRIGRVQSLAGSLLSIKPIIRVDKDGKYSTYGRGRTMSQTITSMAKHIAEMYGTSKPLWVTVMHGQMADKAQTLADELSKLVKVGKLETQRISPVLGVHTGPGIVGVGIVPMELMEGW